MVWVTRGILAGLLLAVVCASSQEPSPTPVKAGQDKQSKASSKRNEPSNDQRISDALATAINKLAAEIATRKQQSDTPPQKADTPPEWWLKWSTIISAAATFVIAIWAFFQWRTMNKQAQHMREGLAETRKAADAALASASVATDAAKFAETTLRLTERADVLVDTIEFTEPHFASSKIRVTLRNFGRTRANSVLAKCTVGVRETNNVEEMPQGTPFVLGAGAEMKVENLYGLQAVVGDQNWTRVFGTHELLLRVWGTITYLDVFNVHHSLTFSARYAGGQLFIVDENQSS